ncbi:glycosyltransferase [Paramicrobacterium agarici]|uniref:glycosyltransferase n=1 Tax=Paramicrobacterium agarici TaxID=630514 RepID=UPI00114F9FCF|nr:glycosyltransferase [Microbacterium agarici]TQO23454.1 glycosyltransferase involved in cell wall biosynthesis [Microbacterium agarici]
MSQRRTLVLSHTAQEGGAELALVRLARALRERGEDVRVLLFATGPLEKTLADAGVPADVRPLDPGLVSASRAEIARGGRMLSQLAAAAGFAVKLRTAIRQSNADLIVANTLKAAVFAMVAAPISGRAWVWHVHDRLAPDYLPRVLVTLMRAIALFGPRTIVVNSQATLATIPRGARNRVVLAYPGLADEAFVDATPDSPRVVGIVGRISPTKGQRVFVDAAGELARTHPDVRFRVVGAALFGESDYDASVRDAAERWGLGERLEFTGWVSDVSAQIARLTVLVHASPVPEPFGQVVVEALAAGVPVVAAQSGGVVEILDASETATQTPRCGWRITDTGVLVRPGDSVALAAAISAVLDDPAAARTRSCAARAVVRDRFTIAGTADAVSGAWGAARRQRPSQRMRRRRETAN